MPLFEIRLSYAITGREGMEGPWWRPVEAVARELLERAKLSRQKVAEIISRKASRSDV